MTYDGRVVMGCLLLGCVGTVTHGSRAPLDRAGWLAGCWRREASGSVVDEQWMAPLGGTMLGMSRTVRDGRLVEYEHLRIEARAMDVYFVAIPSRQERTEFRLAPGEGPTLVFENPEHDFPKAIRYAPLGADSLLATISGDGREVPFPYARTRCPGTGPQEP